jgi:peptidoglycan/LPS O-acetylase OafA/YrhL
MRAFAVIIVVIFHFDKNILMSGYIGVDIFFVISGYLITMIGLKRVHDAQSLKQFYIKRIMRIFPVLLFISFVTIFFLSLIEYLEKETLQMIRDTIIGYSNARAEKISLDYFGDNSNNYFLHLWSISIELQFYLFFPLLLLSKMIRKNILSVIIVFGIFSFSTLFFEQTYYNSIGRMFAFSSGALAFLLSDKIKPNNYIYFISLSLLVLLCFVDLDVASYPNYNNILVVFLTVVGILFGKIGTEKRYGLLVFIGLISYSIYLWHYPILLFFNHSHIEVNIINIAILIMLMMFLSMFTYYFIEKKFIPKNYGNYTMLLIIVPQLILISILYYKKTESFSLPLVEKFYNQVTLNPLLNHSELENLRVTTQYKGCLNNKGELLKNCSSTQENNKTKTALVLGNSFVHSGGLVFIDKITSHYNIKSDFYYLIGSKKGFRVMYPSIKAKKYDYLILYFPWTKATEKELLEEYKELSKYTQIIFIKGPKFNMSINNKQQFRFNNLHRDENKAPYICTIKKPFTSDKGYSIVDSVLSTLHAKSINIYDLQKDDDNNYMCSFNDISLFNDAFHLNNYAGQLFAEKFINNNDEASIFD